MTETEKEYVKIDYEKKMYFFQDIWECSENKKIVLVLVEMEMVKWGKKICI